MKQDFKRMSQLMRQPLNHPTEVEMFLIAYRWKQHGHDLGDLSFDDSMLVLMASIIAEKEVGK